MGGLGMGMMNPMMVRPSRFFQSLLLWTILVQSPGLRMYELTSEGRHDESDDGHGRYGEWLCTLHQSPNLTGFTAAFGDLTVSGGGTPTNTRGAQISRLSATWKSGIRVWL
jgi:hypothetical protein